MKNYSNINPNPPALDCRLRQNEEQVAKIRAEQTFNPDGSMWFSPTYITQQYDAELEREIQKLSLQNASSINVQPTNWVFDDWLATGELTILAGDPGTAKTTLACALAAAVTHHNGNQLHPRLKANSKGHVIIVSSEDSWESTLVPRLISAGANLNLIHFIDTQSGKDNESPFSFSNDRDINRLIGFSNQLDGDIILVIVDPVYLAVDGDFSNKAKSRLAYQGLANQAKRLKCSFLGIAHTTRNSSGKGPLDRIAGTPALREVPRGIILASKIQRGPTASGGTHVFVHAKSSLGKTDGGFEYKLEEVDLTDQNTVPNFTGKGLKLTITDEKFGSAEDILKEADRPKPVENVNKTKVAEDFLRTTLKDGPKLSNDVVELALKANITKGTLNLAKTNLGIEAYKRKGDGCWVLSLPNIEVQNAAEKIELQDKFFESAACLTPQEASVEPLQPKQENTAIESNNIDPQPQVQDKRIRHRPVLRRRA